MAGFGRIKLHRPSLLGVSPSPTTGPFNEAALVGPAKLCDGPKIESVGSFQVSIFHFTDCPCLETNKQTNEIRNKKRWGKEGSSC